MKRLDLLAVLSALLGLLVAAAPAHAQVVGLNASPAPGGGTTYSVPIQTLLLFSALSFLPAVLLLMTSFTRIVIVLALMRQALGLQSTPPNQVIVGMSLFLTLFVMGPTLEQIHDEAYKPYTEQKIGFEQAAAIASAPLRDFMLRQTRESDIELFASMALPDPADAEPPAAGGEAAGAADPAPPAADAVPMRVLIPAFVVSELKTAFQIGFLVFIPFLMIDLIVSSVLMSMGMMMLSPVLVSLPFKLMLFVLADGWSLLVASMVASF
ncbi:MAG: flagellar type III secretion system pore protein FliP [Pseudomonadota bacterium]|jgi:flagellar biosynthetic protein FliP|nr:flagellar type III secretion system pore protein FliP [Pseudomonadota bacterium]